MHCSDKGWVQKTTSTSTRAHGTDGVGVALVRPADVKGVIVVDQESQRLRMSASTGKRRRLHVRPAAAELHYYRSQRC